MLVLENNHKESVEDHCLIQRYGYLMSVNDLAGLLGRPAKSIYVTISNSKNEFAKGLLKAKFRLGRRIYFKTSDIAELIDGYQHVK